MLDDQSIEIAEMSVHTPDLDDVFLTLTGNPGQPDATGRPVTEMEPVR